MPGVHLPAGSKDAGREEHLSWTGGQGNIIPAIRKIAEEVFIPPKGDGRPKNQSAFVRVAEYARPFYPHPAGGAAFEAYGKAMALYWGKEELTAQQAVEKAAKDSQDIIDEWSAKAGKK